MNIFKKSIMAKNIRKRCNVFSNKQLFEIIDHAVVMFNEAPETVTSFTTSGKTREIEDLLTEVAILCALGTVESGNSKKSFAVPTSSDLLGTKYSSEMNSWYEKVKAAKSAGFDDNTTSLFKSA